MSKLKLQRVDGLDWGAVPVWVCTGQIRWITPEGTSPASPKLQMLWYDQRSGDQDWRTAPLVAVPQAEFDAS